MSQYKYIFIALIASQIYSCQKDEKIPPNVIVIMTDDQGYGDIAAHGNPYIETPNIDKLHDQSVRLENFHVAPTCSPTRAQLITGRYNHRVGVWHTVIGRDRVDNSEMTMGDVFAENGYATGIFGKWHLGDDYPFRPSDRGFQKSVIHKAGAINQMADYWDNDRMNDTYFRNDIPEKFNGYSSDVFFDEAISFMSENHNKPFFTYIPTSAPHAPNNVRQSWADKYLSKGLPDNVSNFYAAVERIDFNVGKLRKFLKESGLDHNTILVFLTDNGSTMPTDHNSAGMRGFKGSVYEGGHRVPCYIAWPDENLIAGVKHDELTTVMDLMPTFIEACDLKLSKEINFDGQSLMPLLLNKKHDLENRFLLVEQQRIPTPEKWRTCVMMNKNWRLVNGKELYNLETDFGQKQNVAIENQNIVKELRTQYEEIWEDVSINDQAYHPLIVGTNKSSEILLTAQDWYWRDNNKKPNLVVGQSNVRVGKISNGLWPIEVARDGTYLFELRRWPKESGLSLGDSTAEVTSETNDIALKNWGDKPVGKVLNITKAKLKIGEIEKEVSINASEKSAQFSFSLQKGLVDVQTYFYTSENDTLGAYYVNVKKIE